ncbi:hypothetical protein FQA39_LY13480 [Lamprigera yunnana]|nr:hypothetical protein FQA39_LY13480 [Lamprigera yunnana]
MWMLYAEQYWTKAIDLKSAVESLYEKLGALEFNADHEAIYEMERYYTVQQCEELRDEYKIGRKLISNMSSTLRKMAFNVYQWIKSQNEDQCTKEIKEKVSRATGVFVKTIERIIKEGNTSPEAETDKTFKSPEKNEITCVP